MRYLKQLMTFPGGLIIILALIMSTQFCTSDIEYTEEDEARLEVVRTFADNVLEKGRDHWSGEDTPLLADGINVITGEPVVWRYEGEEFIIHNLASQQNLFRVLTGLTKLTGEERYKSVAKDAIRYHFDNLVADNGLLRWGGHQFIDLRTLEPVGHFDADCHEFKTHYPYYELMWEVDQEKTRDFIRAFWKGHVLNWRNLAINRHAGYGDGPMPKSNVWNEPFNDPEPFFESEGLSFLNCGSDLIYSAGILYDLNGEEEVLEWAMRMAGMYTKARHPETGMGSYQYTKPKRRKEPPDGPLTGKLTWSSYGDRTENQFGHSGSSDPEDEFYNPIKGKKADDGMLVAREGWFPRPGGYPWYAIIQLHLAEIMDKDGKVFAQDAADHLEAHARHMYEEEENHFLAMWADGTDVTGLKIPRTGYHGEKGEEFEPREANEEDLMTYARAYRLTGRSYLWETIRAMARGLGMGDIGENPGREVKLNLEEAGSSPDEIFALLELYRISPNPSYIKQARLVADNMIAERFHDGYFLPGENHVNVRFDTLEPLALLALDATIRGEPEKVPTNIGSEGFIHGQFDGHGRTRDHDVIWNQTR